MILDNIYKSDVTVGLLIDLAARGGELWRVEGDGKNKPLSPIAAKNLAKEDPDLVGVLIQVASTTTERGVVSHAPLPEMPEEIWIFANGASKYVLASGKEVYFDDVRVMLADRRMCEADLDLASYAAITDNGKHPIVFGVAGSTLDALADAKHYDENFSNDRYVTVRITPQQCRAISTGDVDCKSLGIELSVGQLRVVKGERMVGSR